MAGPIPQTPTQFWSNVSVAAGATQSYEFDSGQCYFATLIINVDLDASATEGATLRVYEVTEPSGTKAERPRIAITLDDDPDGVSVEVPPGTYSIEVTNDDGSYALTLNGWYRLRT